jgi:hypothetical protein
MILRDFGPLLSYCWLYGDHSLFRDFGPYGIQFMNVYVVITVARDSGPGYTPLFAEGCHLHTRRRKNLKSHNFCIVYWIKHSTSTL